MTEFHATTLIILLSLLSACATNRPISEETKKGPVQKSPALVALEQRRKTLEEKRQDDRDRLRLLQKKSEMQTLNTRVNPQEKKLRIELESGQVAHLTDSQLYGELISHFERNDEIGFQSRFQMMMSKYSHSPLADDSLYLAGLQQVGIKNYGKALKYFNRLIQDYPYGNKTGAALFAKGAVYRKMNLDSLAMTNFKDVLKRYPGSPEAFRAQAELRLLK